MDSPARASRHLVLPLALFAALGLVNLWQLGLQGVGIDFFQFWAVGQAVEESIVHDVYDPAARPELARVFLKRAEEGGSAPQRLAARFRSQEIQVSNSPLLYAFFHLIQGSGYEADFARYRLICIAGTVFSVLALCRRMGFTLAGSLAALAFVVWAFNPLVDDVREGNVNQIQLAGLAIFLVLPGGSDRIWPGLIRGAVLGAAIAFKPNLIFAAGLLGLGWILGRRLRTLVVGASGMAAGLLAAIVSSLLLFGSPRPWLAWARSLDALAGEFRSAVGWGNFAGGWLLRDLLGVNLSPFLYLLCISTVAGCVWLARRRASSRPGGPGKDEPLDVREDQILASLGPAVPLLAGDLAWPHYLVLTIPLLILLFRPRPGPSWLPWGASAALLLVCSRPLLETIGAGGDYVTAAALFCGAALLFVLGCAEAAGFATPHAGTASGA